MSLFSNLNPFNLYASCFLLLVCISKVMTHLLTSLPYLEMTMVRWQVCQTWLFWHFWHKWRIWHSTFLMTRYGNMGVKRSIRTSGMQINSIKQLVNRFNVLKFQNTDFQNFPLYFPKFPLYILRTDRGVFQLIWYFSGESLHPI